MRSRARRLIGYLALAALIAAAGWTAANAFYATVVVVTCAVVVTAMAWRREYLLDPLGPVLLVVVTSATLPAALGHLNSTPTLGIAHDDYVRASFALLLFIAIAVVVYLLPQQDHRRKSRMPAWANAERLNGGAAWLAWGCLFLLALTALAYVVRQAGDPSTYLDSLASRVTFFSGRSWAILALVAPSVASLVLVVALAGTRLSGAQRLSLAGVVLSSAGLLALTGSRTSLVAYLASLAIVYHLRVRRLRPAVVLFGVIALAIVGSAALGLRTDVWAERELSLSSVANVYEAINTYGPVSDFGHMSSLAMIMDDEVQPPRQYGQTYLAAATILLPRSIAPWKLPLAGEVATRELLPTRWKFGTGIQPTAPGEAFLNFGWPGIAFAGLLFGVLLRLLKRLSRRDETFHVLVYALALPHVALLLRGHLGGEVAFFGIQLLVLAVCLRVSAVRVAQPAVVPTAKRIPRTASPA